MKIFHRNITALVLLVHELLCCKHCCSHNKRLIRTGRKQTIEDQHPRYAIQLVLLSSVESAIINNYATLNRGDDNDPMFTCK